MTTSDALPQSLASRLAKRLPRVLVPYLGGTWGLVQFLDWATSRYMLSPFLVELAGYAALLLLPTALILAYFRSDHALPWTRAEKLGIPMNLVAAAALLFVTFHSKDLGAVTRQIEVKNASGQTVERQIPKTQFRKHVAIFFFDNRSGDGELDWLRQGVVTLLDLDLSQDLFVDSKTQYNFDDAIKKVGLKPVDALPLALQQEIARDAHLDFMVFGTVERQGPDYVFVVELAPTSRATPIAERRYQGPDVFKLVDQMSTQLRKDLGIPAAEIDSSPDLPVSEISTHALPAMRAFVLGNNQWSFDSNNKASIQLLDQAVKIDPQFGIAWMQMIWILFDDNQLQRMHEAMAATKRNEYRLSERLRFQFESTNAILNQDPAKELGILRQWVTLYPDDTQAHLGLVDAYSRRNRLDDAALELRRLLELDPGNPSYLIQAGQLSMRSGDYAGALKSYSSYAERNPRDPKGYVKAGDAYEALAQLDQAKASFARALALDPDQIDALVGTSRVEMHLGHLDLAKEAADRAEKGSPPPRDLVRALEQQSAILDLQGKPKQSIATTRRRWQALKSTESASEFMRDQLQATEDLVEAGRSDEAQQLIAVAEKLSDNVNMAFAIGMATTQLYVALHDSARATAAMAPLEKLLTTYAIGTLNSWFAYMRGRIDELNGAYASAAANYQDTLRAQASNHGVWVRLAHCQRQLKLRKEAHASLARALAFYPASPKAHAELAGLLADEGERAAATAELAVALKMWSDAEPDYKPAAEARQLAAELAR